MPLSETSSIIISLTIYFVLHGARTIYVNDVLESCIQIWDQQPCLPFVGYRPRCRFAINFLRAMVKITLTSNCYVSA